ncbi:MULTISPECIES: Ger(x)C family spore germination protein [Bacillus]|uniref:Uncharacterized protein n=2 Tax=Bacillus TaxID=1386 RepID=A0A0M4FR60_9BACI|nr:MULTISPECIES: Ger(x)C family spore germination protein [Bacillus]ALC81898.1 hypothetical protein AM592_09975 [Bacillus gobiensis]MBP1083212.1 spore germination protein KC [Bacillus capparidis]MED1097653.1 Ger(x)C family spore germination protein [Bacillus capparidis]
MNRNPFIILVAFLSIFLLSGCWDRNELQELDVVGALGIDLNEDTENKYRVTVQIINEQKISTTQGQGGGSEAAPVTTFSASGSTIHEAFQKISPQSSQKLFFPHVQLMVIGEELAREEGIQDLFDWIERDSQFRTLFPILIARDHKAEELLQITTSLESVPAVGIADSLKNSRKGTSTQANQVIQQLSEKGVSLTGLQMTGNAENGNSVKNVQQISPETKVEIKGIAVFKQGKLTKWLDGSLERGAMWINKEVSETNINLPCKKEEKDVAVDLNRYILKIKAKIKNGKPVIDIKARAEGEISEVQCPIDLSKHESIEKLENEMAKKMKAEMVMAVEAAKEARSDFFHFGEYVNREDPKLYKKIEKTWDEEIFPETDINVDVQAFIRRTGLRTKSYIK